MTLLALVWIFTITKLAPQQQYIANMRLHYLLAKISRLSIICLRDLIDNIAHDFSRDAPNSSRSRQTIEPVEPTSPAAIHL